MPSQFSVICKQDGETGWYFPILMPCPVQCFTDAGGYSLAGTPYEAK